MNAFDKFKAERPKTATATDTVAAIKAAKAKESEKK